MTTKRDLLGSFGSLLDTLRQRFDPLQPADVNQQWLGVMNRAASLARDAGRWELLDDESPAYDAVVVALDDATRALVTANFNDPESVLSAIAKVDVALDALDLLF